MERGPDFSRAMLAIARAREPTIGFDEGDAAALAYPDGVLDAVVAIACRLARREAHRALCPARRVAFSFWAAPRETICWQLALDLAAAQAPAPGWGHSRRAAGGGFPRTHGPHGACDLTAPRRAGAGGRPGRRSRSHGRSSRRSLCGRWTRSCMP